MSVPERARQAGRALYELGGAAKPGDVGAACGFEHSRQARALDDLERAGLVTRTRAWVKLTPAGRQAFAARPRPTAGALEEAIGFWPHRHRAFLELLLSAVVARHHLPEADPVGFIVVGRTGIGKSAMVEAACELFGLHCADHTVMVPEQTEGELLGRRYRDGDGWRYEPPAAASRPLVLFDEFDKATSDQQRMVWTWFQGRETNRNGQRLTLAPVPVIAANYPRPPAAPLSQLREEYRRRSVVLDAGDQRPAIHLEHSLEGFYRLPDHPWRGVLRLDELVPPEPFPALRGFLRDVQDQLVTDQGQAVFIGSRALEALSLGRAAIYGTGNRTEALLITITDYLTCLESVPGLVVADWYRQMAAAAEASVAPGGSVAGALARARTASEQARARAHAVRRRQQADDLDQVAVRAELVHRLGAAAGDIDGRSLRPEHRQEAAGLRAQLVKLRASAANVAPSRLAEVAELAARPLQAAADLRARDDRRRADDAARAEQQRQAKAEQTRMAKLARAHRPSPRQLHSAQRAEQAAALAQVVDLAKRLEQLHRRRRTRPEDDPFDELRRFRMPNGTALIAYEPPAPPPEPNPEWGSVRSFLFEAFRPQPPGRWRSTIDPQVSFPGHAAGCQAFSTWGAATRQVIAAPLRELYALEDQLRHALGRQPRTGRADLDDAPPAALAPAAATPAGLLAGPVVTAAPVR